MSELMGADTHSGAVIQSGTNPQAGAEATQPNQESEAPKVSVVIPTYNGERWIREAIDSVLGQSLTDFEIIVADDASTDSTVSIAREYMSDARLKLLAFDDNLGLGGNWNRGLKQAKGTYLKVLCQDDLLLDGCLETSVSVLESTPSVSLVTSFGRVFGDVERVRGGEAFPATGEIPGRQAQQLVIEKENWIGAPTAVMFRREDMNRVGFFDSTLPCNLDWEMWLRLLRDGNLYVQPSVLHATRFHDGKESMRCTKNLGFEKDRVAILSRLRGGDSRYGEWKPSELRSAWTHAVRSLFRAAKKRKSVPISSIFSFLSQYQSGLKTAGVYMRLQIREFVNQFMPRNNQNSTTPEAS